MPAPYTRTHNFATDTNLVAGTGNVAVRVGVGDELAAAQAGAHALAPEHFSDGIFQHGHLATPRNCYTARFGFTGDWGPARWRFTIPGPTDAVMYRQERMLGRFTSRLAFRLLAIDFSVRGIARTAESEFTAAATGSNPEVTFQFRRNGRRAGRLCRDLTLADFRVRPADATIGSSLDDALEPDSDAPQYVCRIGSETGSVPLLLTEFAAQDSIVVAGNWGSYFTEDWPYHVTQGAGAAADFLTTIADPTTYVTGMEQAFVPSPAVTFYTQQLFQ